MKPLAIIQARTGSTRLPGKVLSKLGDLTVLELICHRCAMSSRLQGIMIATTTKRTDDPIAEIASRIGADIYRGSETDVLDRYLKATESANAKVIVRITADCPLIDPDVIDEAIDYFFKAPSDYAYVDGYPLGLGAAEVLSASSLRRAWEETAPTDTYFREHVMTYLTDHPEKFAINIRKAPRRFRRPHFRLTLDEPADLKVVQSICRHFSPRTDFRSAEIIEYLDKNPVVANSNRHVRQKTR